MEMAGRIGIAVTKEQSPALLFHDFSPHGVIFNADRVAEGGDMFVCRDPLAVLLAVENFTVFTKDNDPYGEHDCARFTLNGQCFFWAIDYYDETCTYRSRDPCDEFVTTRVLTLMLAQDY
jgi:hypothetical protein